MLCCCAVLCESVIATAAAMQVLGQSRGWLLRALSYEDEVFALVSLALERHSLASTHATFAESLYGLRRRPAPRLGQHVAADGAAGTTTPLLSGLELNKALACAVRHGIWLRRVRVGAARCHCTS